MEFDVLEKTVFGVSVETTMTSGVRDYHDLASPL